MNQTRSHLIIRLVTLAVLSLVLAACGAGANSPQVARSGTAAPGGATQRSEVGEVTVTATWDTASREPVFTVALDTHSVDLDAIDLTTVATLSVDGTELRPIAWDAALGGHHREGTLSFPTTTADGRAVVGPQTNVIELVIRDVAGVPERTFRWTIAS
jgi:hypothetical protein